MRYFTYIAEQSFKTSETGERLFYRNGPWSAPYIIPDTDTEHRLYNKQVWLLRILLGALIFGQPFLFVLFPQVLDEPYWFVVYIVAVMAVSWLAGRLVFASDLKGLRRAPAPLRPKSFYAQMASRHGWRGLWLGFLGSLLFVMGGVWMLIAKENPAVGFFSIGFFGLCAAAWGYTLFLKSQTTVLADGSLPSDDVLGRSP